MSGAWAAMWNRVCAGVAVAGLVLGACTADAPEMVAPIARPALQAQRSAQTTVTGALTDREILEAFYYATGGQDWVQQGGWMSDLSIADWEGVTVDGGGRVRRLSLWFNNLSGSIPPELGNLGNLEELDLSANQLTGAVPPELGNLDSLEELELEWNQLTGSIPSELGNLPRLSWLSLYRNRLTGSIPPELGNLDRLVSLALGENQLTGPIPPELGGLDNLQMLFLSDNQLTGIPPELGGLDSLRFLYVAQNNLTAIPQELGNLPSLWHLILNHNNLTDSIPAELGRLVSLQELSLAHNQLTGAIPPGLDHLDSLRSLELQDNRLTGSIPAELGNLDKLEVLWLDDNDLSGPISAEFVRSAFLRDYDDYLVDGERLPLTYLLADNNRFSGPTPAELDSISSSFFEAPFSSFISLAGNELTGPVPRIPAGDVRRNYFSGCIPLVWRFQEAPPLLRVNPQRTSTGGTVNLKECLTGDVAAAAIGHHGEGNRRRLILRDELEETREKALMEHRQRLRSVANPRLLTVRSSGRCANHGPGKGSELHRSGAGPVLHHVRECQR
ncbi:MAG: leucine-rich repeat domain-containing protein [Gemmatimonadota bacterium]|nr:leucine-rich repeat domain-containing protein [Gemmatimonadota bacterium]